MNKNIIILTGLLAFTSVIYSSSCPTNPSAWCSSIDIAKSCDVNKKLHLIILLKK